MTTIDITMTNRVNEVHYAEAMRELENECENLGLAYPKTIKELLALGDADDHDHRTLARNVVRCGLCDREGFCEDWDGPKVNALQQAQSALKGWNIQEQCERDARRMK